MSSTVQNAFSVVVHPLQLFWSRSILACCAPKFHWSYANLDVLVERIHERLDVLQDRLERAYGRECEQFLVVPHR